MMRACTNARDWDCECEHGTHTQATFKKHFWFHLVCFTVNVKRNAQLKE